MACCDTFGCPTSVTISINRLGNTVDKLMTVYLAYAEDEQRQHYLTTKVSQGTSLYAALVQAGWLEKWLRSSILFGKVVKDLTEITCRCRG